METFNLHKAIKHIKNKFDNKLLTSPSNLQKAIFFEYEVTVPIEELEKLYENTEDYERESRTIEYGRN